MTGVPAPTAYGWPATGPGHRFPPVRLPRWVGLPLVARLAERELRRRPAATIAAAVAAGAAGAVLAGAATRGGSSAARAVAAVVLVTASAALASATDPTQRAEADLLVRQGCLRTVLRLATWSAAVATVAVPAAAAALIAGLATGAVADRVDEALVLALVLPAAGAWSTAGSSLPERIAGSRRSRHAVRAARLVAGLLLVLAGAALPTTSQSGSDIDLLLPLAIAAAVAGFALLAPSAVGLATAATTLLPSPAARVGATALARNRRGLTVAVTLLAAVTCLLAVQAVLGEGLGERERDRRAALHALGPATIAGQDRVVVVDRSRDFPQYSESSPGASPAAVEDARRGAPDASVAAVTGVDLVARSGRPVYGVARNDVTLLRDAVAPIDVAVATPELLGVLALDPALAAGDTAIVLDARVLRPDGTVELASTGTGPPMRRAALDATPGRVEAGLPAVLLPPGLVPGGGDGTVGSRFAVVRYRGRPSDEQLRRLSQATFTEVDRGDSPVDITEANRTDRVSTVWVRDRSDTGRMLIWLLVLAASAALVAQLGLRLAVRREDEVLALLGAARRTLVAVAAIRGAIIGVVGAALGGTVGLVATAVGLARYDAVGRFGGNDPLAPIQFSVPPAVWIGTAAVPLVAALLGALLAFGTHLRPRGGYSVGD